MTPQQLAERLTNGSPQDRSAAAQALCHLGREAAPAAVALVRGVADPECATWCVAALEELGPPQQGDLKKLTEMLASEAPDQAYWAATLVGRAGGSAAAAAEALAHYAQHHSLLAARERACWALGRVGVASVRPVLEALTRAPEPRLARLAADSLKQLDLG